jgi:hypothetical protein
MKKLWLIFIAIFVFSFAVLGQRQSSNYSM